MGTRAQRALEQRGGGRALRRLELLLLRRLSLGCLEICESALKVFDVSLEWRGGMGVNSGMRRGTR